MSEKIKILTKEQLVLIIKEYYKEEYDEEIKIEIMRNLSPEKDVPYLRCEITTKAKGLILKEIIDEKDIKEILNWYYQDSKVENIRFQYNKKEKIHKGRILTKIIIRLRNKKLAKIRLKNMNS